MLRKPRRARRFERAVEAPCAFWAYVDAHQRVMVNHHTLISRARNPRGSLADFLRTGALREHTGAAIRIFTAGVVEALAD